MGFELILINGIYQHRQFIAVLIECVNNFADLLNNNFNLYFLKNHAF
jgi:hypothetical protein